MLICLMGGRTQTKEKGAGVCGEHFRVGELAMSKKQEGGHACCVCVVCACCVMKADQCRTN